jgi:hypothetical protein
MDTHNVALTAWSFGLVGAVYLGLALRLLRQGYAHTSSPERVLLGAVSASSLWGWIILAGVLSNGSLTLALAAFADLFRYAAWFGFLLLLMSPSRAARRPFNESALLLSGVSLLIGALVTQVLTVLDMAVVQHLDRYASLSSMALSIFGLVLVEQVFRNVSPDSRWNAKPVCLALAGSFGFDLYVYSQGVIFGKVDVDANSIRGAVHALMAPLLLVSTVRHRHWVAKLRVSRKAAFHSATLLISGAYLLFISAVGYYIRFFGGDWGRALQLGVVFL